MRIRRILSVLRLNFMGLAIGLLFYCLALTPSLLPRPAMFEGLVAGLSFAVGYSIGVLVSWAIRRLPITEPPKHTKLIAWRLLLAIIAVLVIMYGLWSSTWQNQVRGFIGEPKLEGQHILSILVNAVITATIVIAAGRFIGWMIRRVSLFVGRWIPTAYSVTAGTVLVGIIIILFYNGIIVRTFVSVSNNIYRNQNNQTNAGDQKPTMLERSGSPTSLVPWDTLGRQGKAFVANGPSQKQLRDFNRQEPKQPIRVYVGINSANSTKARADLAVEELERTGAFDRSVLVVMTATGTGWIEPQSADSLEYIWNGDSALATIQYSYLPSWISFLVDRENATEAGQALFNAVHAKWENLPENNRPKLITYGLSLGSYGGQSAFKDVGDIQSKTDGALFMGTPNDSQPWRAIVDGRDKGSPEWQPVYKDGQTVRFAAQSNDLLKPNNTWQTPRIVYLQHASDPVVWWNPNLIWHKPAWLSEKRGPDVSPNMQWYPFVTFAQVTVDQFFGVDAPNGHGHNYANAEVNAWTSVAQPHDWSQEKTNKLQDIISAYSND